MRWNKALIATGSSLKQQHVHNICKVDVFQIYKVS